MNGLWVVVPLLLLWDSGARLTQATAQMSTPIDSGYPKDAPGRAMFTFMAALLALYLILVPAVLSQAEGVPVDRSQ